MKAISIRQPWAWLIVSGFKDIENRTWETRYKGLILIHAGKYVPRESECREIEESFNIKLPSRFDVGGIVGSASLDNCVAAHKSKWFFGPFGFVLSKARVLPFVPVLGRLGLFDVSIPKITENLGKHAA